MDRWFEQQQRLLAAAAPTDFTGDSGVREGERQQFGIWTRSKAEWFGEIREGTAGTGRDAPEGQRNGRKCF